MLSGWCSFLCLTTEYCCQQWKINFRIVKSLLTDLYCKYPYLLTYVLTYLLTYLLTPWNRVLLEKLTISKIVKKVLSFYGN